MNTFAYVQVMEVTANSTFESVADAFAYGIPLSLFGFATVFAVLALIFGILSIFKVVFYTIPNARKNPKKSDSVKKPEVKVVEPVEPVATQTAPVQTTGDDTIVAAIIAAIEAYRSETTGKTGGFRFVSFKKRI